MIRHFFLDKTCTLHSGSEYNTGNNPIMELYYGDGISRGILHFNEKEIINLIEDKTISDISKLSVKLKMTNCTNINGILHNRKHIKSIDKDYVRALSFDLILLELPQSFDSGNGYEHTLDLWNKTPQSLSKEGCNWFKSSSIYEWDEEGVFSIETIKNEIEKYNNGEENIIVDRQHFENGTELLEMDITSYIKKIINGKENHGLCLMFTPSYEEKKCDNAQYVGFFTDKTNLFFHPFIEINYNEYIEDNRNNFFLGKKNKLYLYTSINGEMVNLDELPVCIIDDVSYEVKQASKGVYYVIIDTLTHEMSSNTIYYDKWSNLVLNGVKIEDVEMEFVVLPKNNYFNIGNNSKIKQRLDVLLSGINDNESLLQGEIREVNVEFQKPFSTDEKVLTTKGEFRIYVKDGNREFDVFSYQPIEQAFLNNFFIINTNDLIPNNYFIDIKLNNGREVLYFKNVLRFTVKNDMSKSYL